MNYFEENCTILAWIENTLLLNASTKKEFSRLEIVQTK